MPDTEHDYLADYRRHAVKAEKLSTEAFAETEQEWSRLGHAAAQTQATLALAAAQAAVCVMQGQSATMLAAAMVTGAESFAAAEVTTGAAGGSR